MPNVNKIVVGEDSIDLTQTNVTADKMLVGANALDSTGTMINGNVVIQKYYKGSSEPSTSLGNNGDLYLKV